MTAALLLAADLILINGRIWTVDPASPTAEAVAAIGERIVAVGTNAEIEAWRGPETRVIDARGRRVLPGFNELLREEILNQRLYRSRRAGSPSR